MPALPPRPCHPYTHTPFPALYRVPCGCPYRQPLPSLSSVAPSHLGLGVEELHVHGVHPQLERAEAEHHELVAAPQRAHQRPHHGLEGEPIA
eukprot:1195829-Prorocentrum_minimum.AAC.4